MEENNVNATAGAETKKSKKGLVIGLGVAFVAVLVIVIVLLLTLGGSKKEITGDEFKKKLEDLGWEVYDYSSLMALDTSGESEGMEKMLMASKDDSAAIFVSYEDEKGAKEYFEKGAKDLEDRLDEEETKGLHTKKVNTGNYNSIYIWGEADGEEGWIKVSRVGKTVVMLQATNEKDFKDADKAVGY